MPAVLKPQKAKACSLGHSGAGKTTLSRLWLNQKVTVC